MGDDSRFMKLVERVPVNNDKLIGQAVSWFIKQQDPSSVEFTQYENGYQIQVFTESENASMARQFWDENVSPHLGGEE